MGISHGLNGGPLYTYTEAVSFVIYCDTQDEIDYYWDKLTQGGEESMCGWLKDQFGVSWQVVPTHIAELMSDPEKAQRILNLKPPIRKLVIETLNKV